MLRNITSQQVQYIVQCIIITFILPHYVVLIQHHRWLYLIPLMRGQYRMYASSIHLYRMSYLYSLQFCSYPFLHGSLTPSHLPKYSPTLMPISFLVIWFTIQITADISLRYYKPQFITKSYIPVKNRIICGFYIFNAMLNQNPIKLSNGQHFIKNT